LAEAVAPLEAAVAAAPDDPGGRVALAAALLETGATAARVREVLAPIAAHRPSRRDVERARALLRRATDGSRSMPAPARRMLGEISALLGTDDDAAGALDLVHTALAAHPDVAAVHAVAALAHARLGNRAEAIAALLRAAELEPEAAPHRQRLGEAYLEMGQSERARAELREAVRLDPLAIEAHAGLAEIAYRQRDWREAAARWRIVASLDGAEPATLLKLGRALLSAERWSEAKRLYEGLLARGARSYEAYVRLGEIHVHSRLTARDVDVGEAHARKARELLQRALEVRPQDPLVQRLLADLERASP
jgi:tetratricopeptide (TPR) repeat protein